MIWMPTDPGSDSSHAIPIDRRMLLDPQRWDQAWTQADCNENTDFPDTGKPDPGYPKLQRRVLAHRRLFNQQEARIVAYLVLANFVSVLALAWFASVI